MEPAERPEGHEWSRRNDQIRQEWSRRTSEFEGRGPLEAVWVSEWVVWESIRDRTRQGRSHIRTDRGLES